MNLPRGSDVMPLTGSMGIGRGVGAPQVTVNVYGSVTSERDLVTTIRNALIQEGA